ncbi:hypothetical protein BpHYR1_021118 [Brachionus plicatilis]|uniref:Uncharacterized protein n=1 Tax=Brachionus plicatilis TaxID=10195 RepID=A0A3M7SDJ4_BRAPC|nr:hypothetical protein BpHYR1_021118 [Brachionus plicatilis]
MINNDQSGITLLNLLIKAFEIEHKFLCKKLCNINVIIYFLNKALSISEKRLFPLEVFLQNKNIDFQNMRGKS